MSNVVPIQVDNGTAVQRTIQIVLAYTFYFGKAAETCTLLVVLTDSVANCRTTPGRSWFIDKEAAGQTG